MTSTWQGGGGSKIQTQNCGWLRMVDGGREGGRGVNMDVHIKFLFLSKKNMNL